MKKSRVYCAAICIAAIVLSASCVGIFNNDKGKKDNQTVDTSSAVSFDDHKPYSLRVKNESGVDLIAFKGKIAKDSLISGVKAQSTVGLKLDNKLFNTTEDFALLFLTKEQYEANKNNLDAVRNQAFTSCYAFYNANGENEMLYRVSSKLGGDAKLVLRNNTKFNIELRVDSPDGDVLGYVAAQNSNTVLNVEAGKDMVIYPVFRRYSAKKNEMYSINPTLDDGSPVATQQVFKKGENELRLGDLWDTANMKNFTTGGCYVTLINAVKTTGVVLMNNGKEVVTSTGVKTVGIGESVTYFIPFPKAGNSVFPETMKLTLGVSTFQGKQFSTKEYEFKRDHAYKFTVNGRSYTDMQPTEIEPYSADDKPVDVEKALFGKEE